MVMTLYYRLLEGKNIRSLSETLGRGQTPSILWQHSVYILVSMHFLLLCVGVPCHDCMSLGGKEMSNTSDYNTFHHYLYQFSSVQSSRSVVSNSLRFHEPQQARPPCPSPTPRVYPNSCPSSWWCHPAISSSVIPFSSCPQSLPASESFPMSQLFASGGQSIGVSALASFLPKNTQGWSSSEWTGWISLQSKELSRVFSNTTVQKHQFFSAQLSSQSNSRIHTWPLEKP